jgi:FMN phosphatase YigB (HAD superfamily)
MTKQRGGLPELIILDVGGTLGESTAPTVSSRLIELSPLPNEDVKNIIQHVLLVAHHGELPSPNELCAQLDIDPALWPIECVTAPFEIYPATIPAVTKLATIAPVVTLSNSPAWHAHHHETLTTACSPHLTALYTSYGLGVPAKPDPAAFHLISARHNVPLERIAAVGDRWSVDIVAALNANIGTIIWTSQKPDDSPQPQLITNGRVHAINDISDAVPLIEYLTNDTGAA